MKLDLGIVFGSNGENAQFTFAAEKELAKKMIDKYDISTSATLIGAISYDNDARVEWRFGDVIDAQSTIERIDRLQRYRNGNNVLKALEIARDVLFKINNGARRDVPKTLIVLIDKTEARDQRLGDTAKQLKDKGVKVIVIAIGPEVDKKDVAGIVSDPKDVISSSDPSKSSEDVISKAVARSIPGKGYSSGFRCKSLLLFMDLKKCNGSLFYRRFLITLRHYASGLIHSNIKYFRERFFSFFSGI